MVKGDKNFMDKVITGDESNQSSERVGEHSARQKKLRFQNSKVKTMLIVFF